MKYKFLLIIALLFVYASSCEEDEIIEPFDHAAQALKDNDSLVKYMQNHFVDADGELQFISDNETAIYDFLDEDLIKKTVTITTYDDEEIDFNLYYYIHEQGVNDDSPTKVDWANVAYKGFQFESHINSDDELVYEEEVFDQNDWGIWADLYGYFADKSVIKGWSEGLIHFKSGTKLEEPLPDGTFEYVDTGKGILFIPSGLAYSNAGFGDIMPNTPLIFYVELNEVFRIDHDEDTVLSMFEDIDGDGDYADDDTDEDGVRNIYDSDDDGDGILTKDENPDPNGDGNPSDAQDTDGDGTPDYLDDDN